MLCLPGEVKSSLCRRSPGESLREELLTPAAALPACARAIVSRTSSTQSFVDMPRADSAAARCVRSWRLGKGAADRNDALANSPRAMRASTKILPVAH
jgi:hypothetical protein